MKLVLIDRDGVINEELPWFVKSADELRVMPAALEGLRLFKESGFTCVVITNQSVVGRGIISEEELQRIHADLCKTVATHGGLISDIFYCTDHPDKPTHRRKPGAGMLIEAMEKYGASPASTPFIGDALTDMEAGLAAGCSRYLVMTGKGRQTLASLPETLKPITACADLLDAARKIAGD